MRVALVRAVPVFALAVLGCGSGSTLPSEETLRLQPASRQVIPDYDLNFTFENNSSAEVGVAELSCTSVLQRQTPHGWVDTDEFRACPKPLHPVPAGGTYAFSRTMPSISGTFRLGVTVSLQGETHRPALEVYSPGIEVRWPPDLHGDLAAVVAIREVVPGGDLAVQFENRSDAQVAVGELSCVTEFERKTATGWQRISSLRMCIELLRLVDGGASFSYVTPAPETPGTYRVIFRAFPTGESGAVDVRSGEFEVTAP
jgi:hypothetical protein